MFAPDGGTAGEVAVYDCRRVCQKDNTKSSGQIFMRFGEQIHTTECRLVCYCHVVK